MKKIFGWVFIIAGIGNIIRVIGLASEGIVGGDKKIGELFLFGIGFMALGGWMVYSSGKKTKREVTDNIDSKPTEVTKQFNSTWKVENEGLSRKTVESNNYLKNHNDEKVSFFSFAGHLPTLAFVGLFLILMVFLWLRTSQEIVHKNESIDDSKIVMEELIIDSVRLNEDTTTLGSSGSIKKITNENLKKLFLTFKIGSSKKEVRDVMGTPTAVYEDDYFNESTWYYGTSRIVFKHGKVREYKCREFEA